MPKHYKKEFTYKGRRCKIVRDSGLGHYCGYIRTGLRGNINSVENKLYRLIDVHGGITYGVDEEGWVGFDTAHARDINKDEEGNITNQDALYDEDDEKSTIWTPEIVREEIEDLADQWESLEKTVHSASKFDYGEDDE